MGKRTDWLLSFTLAAAVIGVSGSYVYRTINPSAFQEGEQGTPVKMRSWSRALAAGYQVAGDKTSLATMVVFADFQCPACRGFHLGIVAPIVRKYPRELRVIYMPFPLSYHQHAMSAARATECAARIGDVRRWFDVLYEKQDSLGLKSYAAFANEIGVTDTALVTGCANQSDPVLGIDAGIALGAEIKLQGTPTVVLEGWVLARPPSIATVDTVIVKARARRE